MEPVTHILTGACLARTGLNRKAAYTTLAMAIAAEFPDIDTLWSIDGPVASFQHHRGWTHTFLGLPIEATFLAGVLWGVHRWRTRRGGTTKAPPNWPLLWGFVLLALLSHLFLDWTNNYGLRPFFPFDPHWYAGSFVFIFEPILFVILVAGLVLPGLFGAINSEIGERKRPFRGRRWSIAALTLAGALWLFRYTEHARAVHLAGATDLTQIDKTDPNAQPTRISASPYPIDPFRWHIVLDTPRFYQMSELDIRTQVAPNTSPEDTIFKAAPTLATLRAKQSWLGKAYLDWSQFPVVIQTSPDPNPAGPITVDFRDLRFLYDTPLLKMSKKAPLTGTVSLDADRRVIQMQMDGRTQH